MRATPHHGRNWLYSPQLLPTHGGHMHFESPYRGYSVETDEI